MQRALEACHAEQAVAQVEFSACLAAMKSETRPDQLALLHEEAELLRELLGLTAERIRLLTELAAEVT